MIKALELFAGAGGMALGLAAAGIRSAGLIEWDRWACDTLRHNSAAGHPLASDWQVFEGDVRDFDVSGLPDDVDLVTGGPPCQPFSMGGRHQAFLDARDMFPATIAVIAKLKPRAFILENVKGLTRASFANYYQYILHRLEYPEIESRPGEEWMAHFRRLQVARSSGGSRQALAYNVTATLVNAADYGVPQRRERVFIVGFRRDLGIEWSFPTPTHSEDSLLWEQWVSGDYWRRHDVVGRSRPLLPSAQENRVRALQGSLFPPELHPWRTTRDALLGLGDPEQVPLIALDHRYQPGARSYPGHTGSPVDAPAKTLKAGDHGVPGGENMLRRQDGSVRYFSVREAARIQTFPDGFRFHGSWSETMRQLGNAVPVQLARTVGASVARQLIGQTALQQSKSLAGRERRYS